jgi:hypothetical protein
MTVTSVDRSLELEMGMEEGLTQAMGQMDGILAAS